jgi:two-component system response regulator QseB
MRILLAEDDLMIGKTIKNALASEGNVVDWVTDGDSCESAIKTTQFAIIILDINLPQKSGLEILKNLRLKKNRTPVLILTARNSITQKVEGLDFGADDYLTKPFDLEELFARIRSLVRRSSGVAEPVLTCGEISLDPAKHLVLKASQKIDLSPKEFAILKLLIENAEKTVSKSRLEDLLYSWDSHVESNAIEVHIHNLRKKVGSDFVKTIRGVGYLVS